MNVLKSIEKDARRAENINQFYLWDIISVLWRETELAV